jgi:hypothetical protein
MSAISSLRHVATGTRLILWGATSGSVLKRTLMLCYFVIVHAAICIMVYITLKKH